jgi:acetyl-CoA carboxylase biotin carboxylase subunit
LYTGLRGSSRFTARLDASSNDSALAVLDSKRSFKKVLVANRGEIAVRITRTLHEMGMAAVAVYSEADRAALHVRLSDFAFPIGGPQAADSYLRIDKIVEVAKSAGCDAIHPGYGFLSENPAFPEACERAGVAFIGPPASAMRAMGSKTAARDAMSAAGVPIVPGSRCETSDEARAAAKSIGYPVMLKAASGGGGKGMRLVAGDAEMANAWERARSEAKKFFGDDAVYLEKAIASPRHVEIQVLGDQTGNLVHLFERDCSIQRRNQKVVEETPSPGASRELVARMGAIAVKGAKAVGYFSAGTFEFLLAEDGSFYFLEMNTRLQVEHPVTEHVTGLDLVREMVRIAQGEPLGFAQEALAAHGAAIECRIYAEDPSKGFLPSPGVIENLFVPSGPGVRDDSGAYAGCAVSSYYDPLISKLSVWAPTRERAVARMRRALSEYVVTGIRTNLAFHEKLFAHPEFVAGRYDTGFIPRHKDALLGDSVVQPEQRDALAAAVAVAAARGESASGIAEAAGVESRSRPSPWVAHHRAAMSRGRG